MSGLTSTWLKDLPLYTPIMEPIISGTTIMLRRCVRTASGRSPSGVSLRAFRSFLMSASGLRFRPRWNLQGVGRGAAAGGQRPSPKGGGPPRMAWGYVGRIYPVR